MVGPAPDGQITMSNGLRLGVEPLPEPPPRTTRSSWPAARARAARSTIRRSSTGSRAPRGARAARRRSARAAYLLAAAGLLDGRRATTHWDYCEALAERYPAVEVDPDPVFVRDGDVWTSAGVTAGMDLALALVEDDLGAEVALAVARVLVVFLKRPGGQSQFSGALSAQQASRPRAARAAGVDRRPSRRGPLGRRAGRPGAASASAPSRAPSGRRSARRPAAYVETLRVERARALLEDGAESLEAVARATGFTSPEVLRRAFHRRVGVSPAAYRERFRLAA